MVPICKNNPLIYGLGRNEKKRKQFVDKKKNKVKNEKKKNEATLI